MSFAFGACGVAYALRRLSGACPAAIVEWIDSHECGPKDYPPGLYVGMAGVAWMMYELGLKDRAVGIMKAAIGHPLIEESCDFLYGMAGTCLASLRFFCWTGDELFLEAARRLGGLLDERKRLDGNGAYWPNGDEVHLGLGRGSSGVAHALLYLALASGDERWMDLGRRALEFEYVNAVEAEDGGWAWAARKESSAVVYQYWRIGGAGVGSVTGRYLRVTGAPEFRAALERIVSQVDRKWSVSPAFATGLSGIGQFHLDMHDLLGDADYLVMARRAAAAIALTAVRRPTGIAFPGDQLERLSCDVATGSAGVGLFLARLLGITRGGLLNLDFLIEREGRRGG